MSVNNITNHRARMSRWRNILLAAVVAVGAVCTGVGVGSATRASDVYLLNTGAVDVPESAVHGWTVENNTDQTIIFAEFHKNSGNQYSGMDFGKNGLAPGEHNGSYAADPNMLNYEYTWGRACYNHQWWNLERKAYGLSPYGFPLNEIHLLTVNDSEGVRLIARNESNVGISMIPTDKC